MSASSVQKVLSSDKFGDLIDKFNTLIDELVALELSQRAVLKDIQNYKQEIQNTIKLITEEEMDEYLIKLYGSSAIAANESNE